MSGWGNLDNLAATGTVTVVSGESTVTGSGTAFTSNIKAGDSVTIASYKYRVTNVANATSLTIDPVSATDSSGVKAYVQQGPKYVANVTAQNTYTIQNVFGVDANEVQVDANKAKNFNQPGWAHYVTYTDAHGQTRYKTETLVAASKNFNENAGGTLQTDAADDTVLPDTTITIGTAPSATSANLLANANATASFAVVATASPTATLTYQWQNTTPGGSVYANTPDDAKFDNPTTATLTVAAPTGLDNTRFRVVVTGTNTGVTSTTTGVKLTVVGP